MARPAHLPDYSDPPLDEVVLGVQFSQLLGYTSVNARDVWELYRQEFPVIQEQPALEPSFETFGGGAPQHMFRLSVGSPPAKTRLWFVSDDQSHLIQFQPDRFILNWRRRSNGREYPRFEGVSASFEHLLNNLSMHAHSQLSASIEINQAEISYISIIPVESYSHAEEWLQVLRIPGLNIESAAFMFNEVISDASGKPFARLTHELQSVATVDGKRKAFRLTLSVRGKPGGDEIGSALEFLTLGREKIVLRFDQMTTEMAHRKWGRKL